MLNTRVRISVPGQGAAIGRVEDIRPPADMPDLAGFATRGEFSPRAIMREWGVTRVAMIRYHVRPDQELMFAALEVDGGDWYDLQHRLVEEAGMLIGCKFAQRVFNNLLVGAWVEIPLFAINVRYPCRRDRAGVGAPPGSVK